MATITERYGHAYGRRAPKRTPAIQLDDILTGATPAYPVAADYLAALRGGWQMLGNDAAGDCVAVTWANMRRLMTATLGVESYPSQAEVWSFYRTQNPDFNPNGSPSSDGPGSGADGGMDIQTALEYLVKTGGPDGVKAVAFAAVDHTSDDEVDAALAIFGGLWVGLNVTEANETEFAADRPWDYVPRSPDEGGHSVLAGGYGAPGTGPLAGDVRFITWATETSFTKPMWREQIEESWVVVWPELLGTHGFETGINTAQLAEDYQDLTGQPLILPPVPPVNPPAPPASADETFAAALRAWPISEHRTRPDLIKLAEAGRAWLEAKGL